MDYIPSDTKSQSFLINSLFCLKQQYIMHDYWLHLKTFFVHGHIFRNSSYLKLSIFRYLASLLKTKTIHRNWWQAYYYNLMMPMAMLTFTMKCLCVFFCFFIRLLGIFGNILSAIVLSRPQMKSSVTCLLLGLAFCDTLLISVSILVFSMPFLNDFVHSSFLWKYENIYFRLWVPYLYPVSITGKENKDKNIWLFW